MELCPYFHADAFHRYSIKEVYKNMMTIALRTNDTFSVGKYFFDQLELANTFEELLTDRVEPVEITSSKLSDNFAKWFAKWNVSCERVVQKRLTRKEIETHWEIFGYGMQFKDEMQKCIRKETETYLKILTDEIQFKFDNIIKQIEESISLTNERVGLYFNQFELDNIHPKVEKEFRPYVQRMWDNRIMDGKNKSLTYEVMPKSWKTNKSGLTSVLTQISEKRTRLNKTAMQKIGMCEKISLYGNICAYRAYGTIKEICHDILHKSEKNKFDLIEYWSENREVEKSHCHISDKYVLLATA